MPWVLLMIAALFEMGWPVGFKLAHLSQHRLLFIIVAIVCMALSGFFLFLAQKHLPIGTAYAVWTGLGTMGTFVIGMVFFADAATWQRMAGIALILGGVLVLKLSHG